MSEPSSSERPVAASPPASSAGSMLRGARQAQGLHIGALAALLKVPQARLEALEADRSQDLPDATFARALAQSVCRVLKIDAKPVLDRLPSSKADRLERVDEGLNMPLRERSGRVDWLDGGVWRLPAFWVVAVFLMAAAVVSFIPTGWVQSVGAALGLSAARTASEQPAESTAISSALPASALAGGIVERVGAAVAAASEVLASAPGSSTRSDKVTVPATAASSPSASAVTRIRAIQASWVQVTDSQGQIVLSRLLAAGEVVDLGDRTPLRVRVGNAQGTEISHRGHVIDLAPATRDNVATLELQ